MTGLTEQQLLLAFLAICVILLVGRGSAEIARRFKQAEVLGELIGGFLIGPSVLGALAPGIYHGLFLDPGVSVALTTLSWIGATLVLLIAGLEVDLKLVRALARPGGLTALFAMGGAMATGILFGRHVLGRPMISAFFLGLVLSVTGVSVIAKILIERDSLRRGYAQVILAAGIASEVVVWPIISIVSSIKTGGAVLAGARSVLFVLFFFLIMATIGRRFTYWAMRRTADLTQVVAGQLSLVLLLTFLSAAATLAMGLHPLLGAFTFGVLISVAPRATTQLKENVQALAVGLFAPIFFVLAGMRVDIFRLRSPAAFAATLLLFVLATCSKTLISSLGARLGGLPWWDGFLIGIGVNLKGGTDVIVAILGVELGILSIETYTIYAVVAILTVLISPSLVSFLERRVTPSQEEMGRLNREEAKRRAYLPEIERVLVPMDPVLLPAVSASVVQTIAQAKQLEGEIFDITELSPLEFVDVEVTQAHEVLMQTAELQHVELMTGPPPPSQDTLEAVLTAGKKHDLIAIGAERPSQTGPLTFGSLQDRIIDEAESDVLVIVGDPRMSGPAKRILVPVNGHEHSMAAADLAGYIGKAQDAEIVLFTVVHARLSPFFWRDREHRRLLQSGYRLLREAKFRLERLGVTVTEQVQIGEDATQEISKELERAAYGLLVLGTVDRRIGEGLQLGRSIQMLVTQVPLPSLLLVTHSGSN